MEEGVVERELTFGEQAVGLNFNPGGNEKVNEVKALYAKIIDLCADLRKECTPEQGERGRYLSIAITEAQTAQMWAVKGITK